MAFTDKRLADVEAYLTAQRFDDACSLMGCVVAEASQDPEAWFLFAACLQEAGRRDDAIDAALRSWLVSGQQLQHSVDLAVDLLRDAPFAQQDLRRPVLFPDDPIWDVVAMLRDAMVPPRESDEESRQ